MTAQPDGINDMLSRDLQALMGLAGRLGEALARHMAERRQEMAREQQERARALRERLEAERAMMRTSLSPVEREQWWETAKPEDIAQRYTEALRWEDHDDVARAARRRIEHEVQQRHGVGAEDYLRGKDLDQYLPRENEASGREEQDTQRDHTQAALHAAEASAGDRLNDTDATRARSEAEQLWDSGDRRAALADRLAAAFGGHGHEAVVARMAADTDQATPPGAAVQGRRRGVPKARKFGPGAGREREMGLG
jgi:colicin import membrane protein